MKSFPSQYKRLLPSRFRNLRRGGFILAALILSFLGRQFLGWSWAGVVLFFVVLLVIGSAVMLGYLFWQRREQKKARVAGEETTTFVAQDSSPEGKNRAELLEKKWKAGLKTLGESYLSKKGDPVYALPWYVTLGREGSGKSSAIRNSKVPMPPTGLPGLDEITATRNLDWWFLDSAVILDTTGAYSFPTDGQATRQEWQTFIQLLSSTRGNEPLNGVIVTVPLTDLINITPETIQEDAKRIRRRINALMNASGMDFPVYLMITQCDRLQGFTDFFNRIPEKGRDQILGSLNKDFTERSGAADFFKTGFTEIVDRLRRLRLSILLDITADMATDKVFILPEEMQSLTKPLTQLVETMFEENPYEGTPFFRGFLFTSSRQEDRPYSHFMSLLGFGEEKEEQPGTRESFFLHDFFSGVLKRDRGFSGINVQTQDWRSRAGLAAILGWSAIWLLVVVFLTYSFGHNRSILKMITPDLKMGAKVTGEVDKALTWLNGIYKSVHEIYEANRATVMPRMGLTHSIKAEEAVRRQYVSDFNSKLLNPLDDAVARKIDEQIATLAAGRTQTAEPKTDEGEEKDEGPRVADFRGKRDIKTEAAPEPKPAPVPEPTKGDLPRHIALILDRIAILKYCLETKGTKDPAGFKQQPNYRFWLSNSVPDPDAHKVKNLKDEYLGYLTWQVDNNLVQQELDRQVALLNKLLSHKDLGLVLLIDGVNSREDMPPVTYGPFWWDNDLSGMANADIRVEPAFTRKGWEEGIQPTLARLMELVPDPEAFKPVLREFEETYWDRYQEEWERFLTHFSVGEKIWKRLANRLESASQVLGGQSPYLNVLNRAVEDLGPVGASGQKTRAWVDLILGYGQLRAPAYQEAYMAWLKKNKSDAKEPGFFSKVAAKAGEITKGDAKEITPEDLEKINLFVEFDEALRAMATILSDRELCLKSVLEAFEVGKSTSASVHPVLKADWNLRRLKELMGRGAPEEEPFWSMFDRLFAFGWQTQLDLSGSMLQNTWEKDVLAEVTALEGWRRMNALLYGENAKVWQFVEGPAAPFLNKEKTGGYSPRILLNQTIPFSREFIKMLESGKLGQQQLEASSGGALTVTLESRPTELNPEAKTWIDRTAIKLQCGDKPQIMEHFNNRVNKTFVWKPNQCRDVEIEFNAGDTTATKVYSGPSAFADFLTDISDGQATYTIDELEKTKGDIAKHQVTAISLRLKKPDQDAPALKFLSHTPTEVPEKIIDQDAL